MKGKSLAINLLILFISLIVAFLFIESSFRIFIQPMQSVLIEDKIINGSAAH